MVNSEATKGAAYSPLKLEVENLSKSNFSFLQDVKIKTLTAMLNDNFFIDKIIFNLDKMFIFASKYNDYFFLIENKIQTQSFDKGKFVGTVGYGIPSILTNRKVPFLF